MDTSAGNPISNSQPKEIPGADRMNFDRLDQQFSSAVVRCEPSASFNCHGLTFGSRRARIWKSEDIKQILKDDGYFEVTQDAALPGDIILYFDPAENDFTHSGVVVEAAISEPGQLYRYPKVVSKWGCYKELIHFANNSPYSMVGVKYYRVRR